MRLNEKAIRGIEPPPTGNRIHYDDEIGGFGLRITAGGAKSFILTYWIDGRQRRYTIGRMPQWNATAARGKAKDLKRDIGDGIDPLAAKQQRRGALTFGDVATEYLAKHAVNKRSGHIDRQRLERDVLPEWRNLKADSITKADTLRLVRKKAETAPVAANRTLALVRKIYNWALEEPDLNLQIEYNPCAVSAPTDEKNRKRKRVLSPDEIRIFWRVLESGRYQRTRKGRTETVDLAMSADVRDILRLVLILGQRPGEVAGLAWDEMEDASWWRLPEQRAKNGREHRVPLTAPAREILKGRAKDSRWVFPSRRGAEKPIEVNALAHALRNNEHLGLPHFTPHDLRRTCSDGMARLKVDGRARAAVLNHVVATVTEEHYTVYTFDDEKKAALNRWARRLREILEGKRARVVSIG